MSAFELAQGLAEKGIGIGVESQTTLRAVTHLDVNAVDIDEALAAIAEMLG